MLWNEQLRHRCRNPRCRGNLQQATDNPRAAFCCEGCYTGFYRLHCVVCEQPFERTSPTQKLCGRRKCRREFDRDPSRFVSPLGGNPKSAESGPKNPTKSKGFSGIKSDRGFGWEAVGEHHHLLDRGGRIAVRLVPDDSGGWWIAQPRVIPELPVHRDLDTAKQAAERVALWAPPPDHKTAAKQRAKNAIPPTDRQSGNPVRVTFVPSTWQPGTSINPDDVPDIPEFLRRKNEP
jgi:hypothetical protein